jgi:hypothetical protein
VEPGPRKRVNVAVCDKWLQARDIEKFLLEHKIDVKMVTKHAIQVHPDQVEKVKVLSNQFKAWIEEKNDKANNRRVRVVSAKIA